MSRCSPFCLLASGLQDPSLDTTLFHVCTSNQTLLATRILFHTNLIQPQNRYFLEENTSSLLLLVSAKRVMVLLNYCNHFYLITVFFVVNPQQFF